MSLYADEVLDYARTVRQTIQVLRISNGCEDDEISFERTPFDGSDTSYVNSNSPSDFSCHVFHPSGGGISPQTPPSNFNDPALSSSQQFGNFVFTGKVQVEGSGSDCADASCNDLIMLLGYLTENQCVAINEKLGRSDFDITITDPVSGVEPGNDDTFLGTYDYAAGAIIGNAISDYVSVANACMKRNPAYGYMYYQVLIAR